MGERKSGLRIYFIYTKYIYTVKPAHVVASIKQSPLLKGHLFLSCHRKFQMN
jgi:hypothetical protein